MRVLVLGGLSTALMAALIGCSAVSEVINEDQLQQNRDYIHDSPFPALNQEIEKLIETPPATQVGLAENQPNAPPGVSISLTESVLISMSAPVVGTGLHLI